MRYGPTILLECVLVLLLSGCGEQPSVLVDSSPGERVPQRHENDQRDVQETLPAPVEVAFESEQGEENSGESAEQPAEQTRPPDRRPPHDDQKLAAAGILVYESRRLKLYTDVDEAKASALPPLVDQLYEALEKYFGPLPPDRRNVDFQITGYLMRDEGLFRKLGLLDEVPMLFHGLHLQNRFWMREQIEDDFRRHLLLHECTHCFMTYLPGPLPPVWYMEGMAELFGTHRILPDGRVEFRILPNTSDHVRGWGRIECVRRHCAAQQALSVKDVYDLPLDEFSQPDAYAWSWALCQFLDSHPRYAPRFRELGQHVHDGTFDRAFHEAFQKDLRDLSTEWTLFELELQSGYDTTRAAIEFQPNRPLEETETRTVTLQADRGWQDVGVQVVAGQPLELSATGQFTLAKEPKPWISEPQGISFRYFEGKPLGRLLAYVDVERSDADSSSITTTGILPVESVGKSAVLTPAATGRLLLRVNDAWDSLADNSGSITVIIRRTNSPTE